MNDWGQGYVTDIPYTLGFYREMTPLMLETVSLIRGQRPPGRADGFTFCELGCGQGYGTALLAASYPRGRFWGFDFNPGQIVHAQALAADSGLTNVAFGEESFETLAAGARDDLPPLDFIALHGIYTWISPANRKAIVRFVARRLKPGGLVYVSYNCLPGWAPSMPLQRLLRDHADSHAGRSDQRFDAALAFVNRLKEAQARYFGANPSVGPRTEKLAQQNKNYLVHEYLHQDWTALYHADVAHDLAAAKLVFLGSATLAENFDAVVTNEAIRKVLAEIGDPVFAQTVRDYFVNQQFRRDIFIRGEATLPAGEQRERLFGLPFALTVPRTAVKLQFQTPLGTANGSEAIYNPIVAALAERPRSATELLALGDIKGQTPSTVIQALALLVGSSQAHPVQPDTDSAPARRFNAVVARRASAGGGYSSLAAPVLGSGLAASSIEMAAYQVLAGAPDAAVTVEALMPQVWSILQRAGRRLVKDGKTLAGDEENRQELTAQLTPFVRDRLPLWRQFGIL